VHPLVIPPLASGAARVGARSAHRACRRWAATWPALRELAPAVDAKLIPLQLADGGTREAAMVLPTLVVRAGVFVRTFVGVLERRRLAARPIYLLPPQLVAV
jgi:hypothetical protein